MRQTSLQMWVRWAAGGGFPAPELSGNLPLAGKAARCHLHTNAEKEKEERENTWQISWLPLTGLPWGLEQIQLLLFTLSSGGLESQSLAAGKSCCFFFLCLGLGLEASSALGCPEGAIPASSHYALCAKAIFQYP